MPTAVRIIIFIAIFIAYFIAIYFLFMKYRNVVGMKKVSAISSIVLVLCFIFFFPSHVFLSYNKMIFLFMVECSFVFLNLYWGTNRRKWLTTFAITAAILLICCYLFWALQLDKATITTTSNTECYQYVTVDLTDNSTKVQKSIATYIDQEGKRQYFFYSVNEEGNWERHDTLGLRYEIVELTEDGITSVEETVDKQIITYTEMREDSEKRTSTTTQKMYVFYIGNDVEIVDLSENVQ